MRLSPEDFWNLVLALALGAPFGAVLFYIALYNGGLAHNLPVLIKDWKLPGGSFWGCLWTSTAFAYIYCRVRKIDFRPVADALGLSAMLSLSVMRVGCFLHGCCYGAPTIMPWGVRYYDFMCSVDNNLLGIPLHPSQLYEALGSLIIFLAAYWIFSRRRPKPGMTFVLSIVSYCVMRFAVDFTRGDDDGIFTTATLTTAQFAAIASAAACVLWYLKQTLGKIQSRT